MRLAIINDTHSGVKNGSDIFLDYSAKFFDDVFFPYLLKNDIRDIVHLGDYFDHRRFVNFKVLKHNFEVFIKNSEASVLMGHLELGGFKYMGNASIKSHGMDKSLFDRYDAVYSGHYHTKSSEGNVTYLGTQYQLTWSDANDPKYFHILNTETRELEAVVNPNVLFQKIYYDEDNIPSITPSLVKNTYVKVIVTNKKDLFVFDKFMEQIYDFNPYEVRIIENFDEYGGDKINDEDVKVDDTPTLLNSYIDATETNLDSNVLKKMMQELLIEAQALDNI